METLKKSIKEWLKRTGKDREWLADRCYVAKRTVDFWLEKRGVIPSAKVDIIKGIIEKSEEVKKDFENTECTIVVKIPSDQFEEYNKDALNLGMTFSEYMLYALKYLENNECKLERPATSIKSERIYGSRDAKDIG